MKAPDKIYVHVRTEPKPSITFSETPENNSTNEEYIRKNTLLEWVKERIDINLKDADITDDRFLYGAATAFGAIIDKLNLM